MRSALVILGVVAAIACDAPTQTIVIVDADDETRAALARARVRVCSTGDGLRLDRTVALGTDARFPLRVPLQPEGGDASRTFALLVEAFDAEDTPRIEGRLVGGFTAGEKLEVTLLLSEPCLDGPSCGAFETCAMGSCRDAVVAPAPAGAAPCDPARALPPTDAGVCAPCGADCPWGRCVDGCCDSPRTVSGGTAHACVITETGSVFCWGNNDFGQAIPGGAAIVTPPAQVPDLSATRLALSIIHSCAIDTEGAVACWGQASGENVGGPAIDPSGAPGRYVPDDGGPTRAVDIDVGNSHACVALATGGVRCWGRGNEGQLGDGTTHLLPTPRSGGPVVVRRDALDGPALRGIVGVGAGATHSCAVHEEGEVYCWGNGSEGQLGTGDTSSRAFAMPVVGLSDAVAVTGGTRHTCALREGGAVSCWGGNIEFAVSPDEDPISITTPVEPGVVGAQSLTTNSHNCALLADDSVTCWGFNSVGQLGRPGGPAGQPPAVVEGVGATRAVAAGGRFTCAVELAGDVKCWGENERGELGAGGGADTPTPTSVPPPD